MKIILLLLCIIFFSCSSEENPERNATPETLTVKYEILGQGEVPKIRYTSNEGTNKHGTIDVSGVRLPFVKEIQLTTKVDGEVDADGFISYGCADISLAAFANRNGVIERMNIYINGKLKDSKTSGYYYVPGEDWDLWGYVIYSYLRRGGDSNTYNCN